VGGSISRILLELNIKGNLSLFLGFLSLLSLFSLSSLDCQKTSLSLSLALALARSRSLSLTPQPRAGGGCSRRTSWTEAHAASLEFRVWDVA